MPAKSKVQQQAAGAALAAKRGKLSPKKLKGAARQMYNEMTLEELERYAGTKHSGLPKRRHKKGKYRS